MATSKWTPHSGRGLALSNHFCTSCRSWTIGLWGLRESETLKARGLINPNLKAETRRNSLQHMPTVAIVEVALVVLQHMPTVAIVEVALVVLQRMPTVAIVEVALVVLVFSLPVLIALFLAAICYCRPSGRAGLTNAQRSFNQTVSIFDAILWFRVLGSGV